MAPPLNLRTKSLTVSPVHLGIGVLELMAEIRLQPNMSVAVIGGYGVQTQKLMVATATGPESQDVDITVIELGAQGRYYLLGDFRHGLNVGLELLYLHGSASVETVSAVATGLAAGPFLGYKFISSFGLTVDLRLGYSTFLITGEATDGNTTQTESQKDQVPIVNLNFGWSF